MKKETCDQGYIVEILHSNEISLNPITKYLIRFYFYLVLDKIFFLFRHLDVIDSEDVHKLLNLFQRDFIPFTAGRIDDKTMTINFIQYSKIKRRHKFL